MDLFPRSDIFMFFAQWVLCPRVLQPLIYKGFQRTQSFFFLINTTVSTWLGPFSLMSWADFLHLTFTGTYQWVFGIFPENQCSGKHIYHFPENLCIEFLYILVSTSFHIIFISGLDSLIFFWIIIFTVQFNYSINKSLKRIGIIPRFF